MKNENGTVMSSLLMGIAFFAVGIFVEPLLMILGFLVVVSSGTAKIVEGRKLKYSEEENNETSQKNLLEKAA